MINNLTFNPYIQGRTEPRDVTKYLSTRAWKDVDCCIQQVSWVKRVKFTLSSNWVRINWVPIDWVQNVCEWQTTVKLCLSPFSDCLCIFSTLFSVHFKTFLYKQNPIVTWSLAFPRVFIGSLWHSTLPWLAFFPRSFGFVTLQSNALWEGFDHWPQLRRMSFNKEKRSVLQKLQDLIPMVFWRPSC